MTVGQHIAAVGRLRPERAADYLALHRGVWPEVIALIQRSHISDYRIFHRESLLFSIYVYTGTDHAAEMSRMIADPIMRRWWAVCVPCFAIDDPTQPWLPMEEIFIL